jgi:hypothetical protein
MNHYRGVDGERLRPPEDVYKPTFTVLKKLTTVLAGSTNVTGFTA